MEGIVKWYNSRKRYGFIEGKDGKDIFVHQTGLSADTEFLKEGDKVDYEVEKTDKGVNAKNVKKL